MTWEAGIYVAIGMVSGGACMFAGVLLGFITDELIRYQVMNSGLVRFSRTVAVALVLLGLGVAFVAYVLGSGAFF